MTFYHRFTAESHSERILKISQHLPKLWAIKYRVVFFMKHGVYDWIYITMCHSKKNIRNWIFTV